MSNVAARIGLGCSVQPDIGRTLCQDAPPSKTKPSGETLRFLNIGRFGVSTAGVDDIVTTPRCRFGYSCLFSAVRLGPVGGDSSQLERLTQPALSEKVFRPSEANTFVNTGRLSLSDILCGLYFAVAAD
jgi:hypothetical protein